MASQTLVRDGLEVVFVIGVGGMLVNVARRLRAGEIRAYRCGACGRPTSRAYPRCRHCGFGRQPEVADRVDGRPDGRRLSRSGRRSRARPD